MATSNKRDVRLAVEIESAGEENLRRLATEVRALAQAGGDAAPLYIELAESIERNVAVARELAVFKQAAESIGQTSQAADEATASARRLRTEYEQQAQATQALQANQARVAAALDATKRQLNAAAEQATIAKNALKGADDATGELARASTSAADKVAGLKKQVGDLGLDLKAANRETSAAEQALRKIAEQSLRADEASRSLAAALRAQIDAQERAQNAARELGEDFTDVAAAQERLDASLRGGAGMLEAAAAAERLAAEERQAAAAVTALTDDLDRQAEVVRGKLVAALSAAAAEYEKEQAAIRESLALSQQEVAAAERKAALANRLNQLRAEETADLRGQTAERERAEQAARGELETIRESVAFLATYNERKQQAAADALEFVLALEREEQAAKDATVAAQKLNDEFERTRLAKQYVVELAAALDAADKQAAEAALQVQKLQGYFDKIGQQRNILEGAFGTTGVRSIQAIEQEMFKLQRALITLKGEFSEGRISLADFERATGSAQVRLAALKREVETIPGDKNVFTQLADGANALVTKFGALTATFATVGFAIAPLLREFVALESTTRILAQVTGSAAEAGRQIEFLRGVAQRSGQAFGEVSQSYAKFAASALQAGLSTETVQKTFQSVALAAGNLGLSSDQAKRALEALGQIASKGVASMEELRQQLGDALPGVLPLLAKELGLTNQELFKLVEAGELSANSAIPALARALESLGPKAGVVDGLVASFNRFKNTMFEAGTELLEGPIGKAAGGVLAVLAKALQGIAVLAVGVSESFNILGRSLGAIAAYASGGIKSLKDLGTELVNIRDESNKALSGFAARALEGAGATTELARATAATATAAAAATAPQAALAAATTQVGTAATGAVTAQQQMAAATAQVGIVAGQSFVSVEQLKIAYVNAIASAKNAADAAKLAAEARKTEVETLKDVVALTGNEVLIKRTAVEAANQLAVAVQAQADAEQKELDLKVQFRAELERSLRAKGALSEQDTKDLARRDDELVKQTQAVQKTIEQAEALERQALAARLAAESMADNADNQAAFAAAAAEAASALERARVALADGTITAAEYRNAVAEAAFRQGLLNDAVSDGTKRLEANSRIQTADTNLRVASIKVKLEELRNAEAKAKADGDETRAAQLKIQVKQAELEITKLNNEAKVLEARASVEATQRILAEADAGRLQLTPEKRAEYETRLLNTQAKLKEAEAAVVSEARDEAEIKRLERLRFAIKATADARQQAAAAQFSNAGRPAAGINGAFQADARDEFGRSAAQRDSLSQQGGAVDNSYAFQLQDRFRSGGSFGADEIPAIQAALKVAEANARLTTGSSVQGLNGVRDATSQVMLLRQVLAKAQGDAAVAAASNAPIDTGAFNGVTGPTVPSLVNAAAKAPSAAPVNQAPTVAASAGGTRTIRLELPGLGSTSINVASDADAARMEAFFGQLQTALARSGG